MMDERSIVLSKMVASDVEIGPFSFIGEEVEIGAGSWIGPHVVIRGRTKIGQGNKIFQFSSIGEIPQDKKYAGEKTSLIIGDNNVFRENSTVHLGTIQGEKVTRIGNNNLFMVGTHIAHDCIVGNDTIFANCSTLAGHVKVGDHVSLGGFTKIAQFVSVGKYAFLIGDSNINKDILPFVMAGGPGDRLYGLNIIGLRRLGFSEELIQQLYDAYKVILRKKLSVEQAIENLAEKAKWCPEVKTFITFLQNSHKGILRE